MILLFSLIAFFACLTIVLGYMLLDLQKEFIEHRNNSLTIQNILSQNSHAQAKNIEAAFKKLLELQGKISRQDNNITWQ